MFNRYFIYNFLRIVLSLFIACSVAVNHTYSACDKENWCKNVIQGQECNCYELGLKCYTNHKTCAVIWENSLGNNKGLGGTSTLFPNYTMFNEGLKRIEENINNKLLQLNLTKPITNEDILEVVKQIKTRRELIFEMHNGIKKRMTTVEWLGGEWVARKRVSFINYDVVKEDVRSDFLTLAEKRGKHNESVITVINKISEQRATRKPELDKDNNSALDASILEFFNDAIQEIVENISYCKEISLKVTTAMQNNNYDDIIEFAQDLENAAQVAKTSRESLVSIYNLSTAYLDANKISPNNIDKILQDASRGLCSDISSTAPQSSQCKSEITKLLQNPQEYSSTIDNIYREAQQSIKYAQERKQKIKEDEEKKKKEGEAAKAEQDKVTKNRNVQDIKHKIANNLAIITKLEKHINDSKVDNITSKGALSEQDKQLLRNAIKHITEYKEEINKLNKNTRKLQELGGNSSSQRQFINNDELDKRTKDINDKLNSSNTDGATAHKIASNVDQDDFSNSKNATPGCNFSLYKAVAQDIKDNSLTDFIFNNINFKCSDTCNIDDKRFEICLKVKYPDSCNNCTKITVDDNSFRSIKELFNDRNNSNDSNDIPILVKKNAVNQTQLRVIPNKGMYCLYAKTIHGNIPLACKNTSTYLPPENKMTNNNICNISDSSKSRVPFNFSGRAMECIKSTLDSTLYGTKMLGNQFSMILKPLSEFQKSMKIVIAIALTLYIIFFGIKIMTVENFATKETIVVGIMKILIVTYMSVGLGPIDRTGKIANGVQDHLLPLLSSLTYDLSQMVFSATSQSEVSNKGAQLCYFDPDKDYKNGDGRNYALWDAIDCRLSYYLGYRMIYNYTSANLLPSRPINTIGTTDGKVKENMKSYLSNSLSKESGLDKDDSFLILSMIWKMLLGGGFILFIVLVAFGFVFIALIWQFVGIFITNLVNLYVMFYLSPITIPMVLFEQTKSIFNKWLTLTLSFALQPGIAVSFIVMFMTSMDSIMYNNCEFVRYDYQGSSSQIVSTFELKTHEQGANSMCEKSPGYRLMEYYNGKNLYERTFLFFKIFAINTEVEFLQQMVLILVFCIIFYYFFRHVDLFASQLTSGISNIDLQIPSLPKIGSTAQDKGSKMDKGAQDKFSNRGDIGAQDKFSNRDTEAKDKFITSRDVIGRSADTNIQKSSSESSISKPNNAIKIRIGEQEIIYNAGQTKGIKVVAHNKGQSINRDSAADSKDNSIVRGTISVKINGEEFNFPASEFVNNSGTDQTIRLAARDQEFTYNISELMNNKMKDIPTSELSAGNAQGITGSISLQVGDQKFEYDINELINNQNHISGEHHNDSTISDVRKDSKNLTRRTDTISSSTPIEENKSNNGDNN